MADAERVKIAQGRSRQAPPPGILFDVLRDLLGDQRWRWLVIADDEQTPVVIEVPEPTEVWWSSLWPAWPELRVRFQIEPDGMGSTVRWSVLAPAQTLNADETEACRYRISYLMNDRAGLRGVFSQ